VETPANLFVRGSVMRGLVTDRTSPIAYGFGAQVPVYFNSAPVLSVAGAGMGGFGGGAGGGAGPGQNTTPMATPLILSPWSWSAVDSVPVAGAGVARGAARGPASAGPTGGGTAGSPALPGRARVVLSFPANPTEMLLSGSLDGGQALANRAQVVDSPLGRGHVVSFAIRPFWRWQTHGTFFLGFNSILHWNDLDAGR